MFLKFIQSNTGGRTKDEIVNWLRKKTGPPAKTVDTVEAAEALTEANDVVVLGFFSSQESDEAKAFLKVRTSMKLADTVGEKHGNPADSH